MTRMFGVVIALSSFAVTLAGEPTPIEMEFVIVNLNVEEPIEADEGVEADAPEVDWEVNTETWMDDVNRLRASGIDARVRRFTLSGYEGLPVRCDLFDDRSECDDTEPDHGSREQSSLEVSCTPTRLEDGRYGLRISVREATREDAPWDDPLMQLESWQGPTVRSINTKVAVRPGEFIWAGGGTAWISDFGGANRRPLSKRILFIHLPESP